jgi:hypothetical protein
LYLPILEKEAEEEEEEEKKKKERIRRRRVNFLFHQRKKCNSYS